MVLCRTMPVGILLKTFDIALGTVEAATNPLAAGQDLRNALVDLQQAAETAEQCEHIIKCIVERAVCRAPILCELITAGKLYPEQNQSLNQALCRTLCLTINALEDACDSFYTFMLQPTWFQWANADKLKSDMEEKREVLFQRFDDVQAHIQLATLKQVVKGIAIAVENAEHLHTVVKRLQGDLQGLSQVLGADKARVKRIANAREQRGRTKGQKVNVFDDGKKGELAVMSLSADGSRIGLLTAEGEFRLIDTTVGDCIKQGKGVIVGHAAFSPDCCSVAVHHEKACEGLCLRNSETADLIRKIDWAKESGSSTSWLKHVDKNHTDPSVVCLAWSPAGSMIAIGCSDRCISLLDETTDTKKHVLSVSGVDDDDDAVSKSWWETIQKLQWSRDGSMLAAISGRGAVKLWDSRTGAEMCSWCPPTEACSGTPLAWSPDGETVAVCINSGERSGGGSVVQISSRTGAEKSRTIPPAPHWTSMHLTARKISAVAWSLDGTTLAVALSDSIAKSRIRTLSTAMDSVVTLDSFVQLLDASTGQSLRMLEADSAGALLSLEWHPSGRELFVVAAQGTVHIYRFKNGQYSSK
jgi:hypothetical protein